jgi:hypothetical protein
MSLANRNPERSKDEVKTRHQTRNKLKREREKQQKEQRKRQADETPQILTFHGYADKWLPAKQAKGLKYTTLKRYGSIVKIHLLRAFGDLPLGGVDRTMVKELVATLADQLLKPKSIKNVLLCLSALYTDAIEDGLVQHNPAHKPGNLIQTAKRAEEVIPFTHEEEQRVLATAKAHAPPLLSVHSVVVSHRLTVRRSRGLTPRGSGPPEP